MTQAQNMAAREGRRVAEPPRVMSRLCRDRMEITQLLVSYLTFITTLSIR